MHTRARVRTHTHKYTRTHTTIHKHTHTHMYIQGCKRFWWWGRRHIRTRSKSVQTGRCDVRALALEHSHWHSNPRAPSRCCSRSLVRVRSLCLSLPQTHTPATRALVRRLEWSTVLKTAHRMVSLKRLLTCANKNTRPDIQKRTHTHAHTHTHTHIHTHTHTHSHSITHSHRPFPSPSPTQGMVRNTKKNQHVDWGKRVKTCQATQRWYLHVQGLGWSRQPLVPSALVPRSLASGCAPRTTSCDGKRQFSMSQGHTWPQQDIILPVAHSFNLCAKILAHFINVHSASQESDPWSGSRTSVRPRIEKPHSKTPQLFDCQIARHST